jgi:micrococcal nuclease
MFVYNAKLIRVIDGDTVDAKIDLGFDVWVKKRIRLYGINTPETRTRDLEEKKAGIAAKDRLSELMEQCNYKFILQSHGVGKYGRCLGTLFIDETNINMLLLNEGHAEEYK